MALSNKLIRQLAIAAGALLVGAVLGQVWRSTRKPVGSSPAGSASATIYDPNAADGGGQVYNLKADTRLKGFPLRQMDREIFAAISSGQLDQSHLQDVFPGQPYRVRMIGSMSGPVATHWVSVVLVDTNRDGKWDERWDLKRDEVDRTIFRKPREEQVAADDADAKFALRQGTWQGF